jgi:hypothetical protein
MLDVRSCLKLCSVTLAASAALVGCSSAPPSASARANNEPLPALKGALAGWGVFWLGRDQPTFDPTRDLTYTLRREGERWTLVEGADARDPGVERIRLNTAKREVILLARPYGPPGASSGRSHCVYGTATSKGETDAQNATYNHCSTKFSYCATTLGDPLLRKVCAVSLDKGALIAALNEAGVGERYRLDQVAADERAKQAWADEQKRQRERIEAREARSYRGLLSGPIGAELHVSASEFQSNRSGAEIGVNLTLTNTSSKPVIVDAHPVTSLTLANGSTYALRPNMTSMRRPWSDACARPNEPPLLNPGQKCTYTNTLTIPGVEKSEELVHGARLSPRSADVLGKTITLSPGSR